MSPSEPDPLSSVEPLSQQEFSRGMVKRAVFGGVLLVIGVLPLIMVDRGGFWAWFGEPFGGTIRAIMWLVLMVAIESLLLTTYVMSRTRRVAAWRRQRGEFGGGPEAR